MVLPKRNFINNEKAVSEEFTTLPALTIVVIGFTIFILLISNLYSTYNNRVNSLDKYQVASFISSKITNPDCFFMMEGGIVNLPLFDSSDPKDSDIKIQKMRDDIISSGFNFSIHISWENKEKYFPEDTLKNNIGNRVAVSKVVSIFLNEAQTKPGKLTVIMWGE